MDAAEYLWENSHIIREANKYFLPLETGNLKN